MSCPLVNLTKIIVQQFNRTVWTGFSAQAARSYAPFTDLEKLNDTKIWVYPLTKASEAESRMTRMQNLSVGVTLESKVAAIDGILGNSYLDPLIDAVNEIQEAFDPKNGGGIPATIMANGFTWLGFESNPIYMPDRLVAKGQFTSVTAFNYRTL